MTSHMRFRLLVAVFFAGSMAYDMYRVMKGDEKEIKPTENDRKYPRYRPVFSSYLLPLYVLVFMLMLGIPRHNDPFGRELIGQLLGVFLHISAYCGLLTLLLPTLRRRFSSRMCAVLWILPNYLYFCCSISMEYPRPLWVIPLPDISSYILFWIWMLGFTVILGWKIVAHWRFRRMLRRSYQRVTDATMLRLWGEAQIRAGIVKSGDPKIRYIPLVMSEKVNTPLAVGLLRPCIDMVMPMQTYSEEELVMIFQHEVVHISREDSWTKFFLVFCTAMCWFNPLMWFAVKRCAEDVELSCDETVLLGAGDAQKKQYAHLLLQTAGDDRGFTTCLSATGQAMRYRLRQVMDVTKKRSGLMLAASVAVALFMSCGLLTFSYDHGTVAELIFAGEQNMELAFVSGARISEENLPVDLVGERLYQYLSQLQIHRRSGLYGSGESEPYVWIHYQIPNLQLFLEEDRLRVFYMGSVKGEEYFYLEEPVDLESLVAMLTQ